MRQKNRNLILLLSLLLFPITMNFLSPYVSIYGAIVGMVSGSVILFVLLFLSGIFIGRAWCGWLCPMGGLSEFILRINGKNVNVKSLRIIRYSVFTVWFLTLLTMFILAGGIRGINPLHLTEYGISVDGPLKYIWYYIVLFLFLLLTATLGKRGACHSLCWMAPFLTAGYHLGRLLCIPQLRIIADPTSCVSCGLCDKKCSMSIPVSASMKTGMIKESDCILCGECVDNCKKRSLHYGVACVKKTASAIKNIGA